MDRRGGAAGRPPFLSAYGVRAPAPSSFLLPGPRPRFPLCWPGGRRRRAPSRAPGPPPPGNGRKRHTANARTRGGFDLAPEHPTASASGPADRSTGELFGHPRGLFVLFFAELWERFSFYGMRALLVLYMTKALLYADELANGTYGAYIGFVYATPLIGGMLADRFLGYRRAILIGGILMSFGHFAMAIEHPVFFFGAMALIIAGNGFFKPNISTLVGRLYDRDDPRRDGAFTIFYMGINIGAGLSPLLCGYLGERIGWHWGFTLAGVGMLVGLAVFAAGGRYLGGHGLPPRPEVFRESWSGFRKIWALYIGIAAFVPFAAYMLTRPAWVQSGVYIIGPLFVAYIVYEAIRSPAAERGRLFAILVLILFSITFWACFEQAGSSINLFTDRHVDRHVFGWEIPASWFQSVNPAFIILLAIPFSALWIRLGRAGRNPAAPVKFGFGLLQLAAGFVALVIAAKTIGNGDKAGMIWVMIAYLLHTTGELCLSPVGLSTVTKLSPVRLVGLMMGVWFLSNAFAGVLSGQIAALTGAEAGYERVFQMIVFFAGGAGLLLLLLSPLIKRLEHGAE
ncbi:MAG: peptide MFS transporter [Candidatus Eisenbacteria bacterium]|nr:peptide MFS transporter [Candidatus Eisenbacteria bacterium]